MRVARCYSYSLSSRKTKTDGIDIESALDVEPHSEERACSLLSEPSSPKRLTSRVADLEAYESHVFT